MTNREWLSKMSDDELADWLCNQMFSDYDEDDFINVSRFLTVRNFLKMEHKEEERSERDRKIHHRN